MAHFRQMRAPQRDQTETREAIKEFETFVARYPNSSLMPEVQAKLREARDRLSEADYQVGYFYYRQKWYPGAIDRFKAVLKDDPEYTGRDSVYFYLAESLVEGQDARPRRSPTSRSWSRNSRRASTSPMAQKRIAELKAQALKPSS